MFSARNHHWPILVVCLACGSSTGPGRDDVRGGYTLELVDGQPLPVAYETGTCPREIYVGTLDLAPQTGEQRPLYAINAFLRSQCDPTKTLTIDQVWAVHDFGEWSVVSGAVWFRSDDLDGYFVPIRETSVGEQGPTLTLQLGGRRYTFRRTRSY